MKKSIFTIFTIIGFLSHAQESDVWRIGAQFGFQGNGAKLIGGDAVADAKFEQHNAGAAGLNFFARYDYNQHWMLLTGFGFSGYGFEFSLSQNYSLLNPDSRRAVLKNDIGTVEIPFMIHYKFDPNCKQAKWIVGAGFTQNLQGSASTGGTYNADKEVNSSINYFTSDVKLSHSLFPTFRFSVGREKILKHGGILNCSLLFNYGFAQNARATVKYSIDGKEYMHQFGNKGNYVGLRLAYYLAPIK